MKIVGAANPFDTNEKRFYVPGTTLEGVCPKCAAPYSRDFEDQYLSYPRANSPFQERLYCGNCEHEWEVTLRVNISVELVVSKRLPRASRKRP